ncbi:MAG: riboflavin synthase [Deltaproteobacteria bacterium]|nr:riboflavin synthase [Deltaproteobacteria bacterium]
MFTGLIEGRGRIDKVERSRGDLAITILPLYDMSGCRIGDSVCVNGACLTVTGLREKAFTADVSAETLSRSTLGLLKPGDQVNLERALRFNDRLGGHLVTGHVDGTGRILKKTQVQGSWLFRIGVDRGLSRYVIEKGSIAVDGISLTINACQEGFFEVNIIPLTAGETTILDKRVGDPVNIETDLIGKYVEKFLQGDRDAGGEGKPSAINREMLIKHGFGE